MGEEQRRWDSEGSVDGGCRSELGESGGTTEKLLLPLGCRQVGDELTDGETASGPRKPSLSFDIQG